MATVIDALLVTLGLDVTDYKKGQKDAGDSLEKFRKGAERNSKEVAAQGKVMAEGFRSVRNELLGLVGIALGATGIKTFFENMVKGQASLARSARNLGMSVRELDAFGAAVETVGGTAQGLQQSLQAIQSGFEAFKLGDSNNSVVAAFRALNINITDAEHKIRPMRDLLFDVAEALRRMPAQDQIRVAQMLGIDEGTLNLLRDGGDQYERTLKQMDRASGVTDASAEAALKAQAKWALFKRELYGVGQTIFGDLVPAMDASNERMLAFSSWVRDHREEIGSFFKGLGIIFTAIGNVAADFADKVVGLVNNINKKIAGTWLGDKIGELVARFAAYGGSQEANDALAAMGVKGYTASGAGAGQGSVNPPAAQPTDAAGKVLGALESRFGLPEGMLDKVWNIESGRGKNMVSAAGATGHFQFMPATAKQMGLSREDTFDFNKSAEAAAKYLAQLLKQNGGDVAKALAAYNWGQGNLSRNGLEGAPKETRDYLMKYFGGMPTGAAANAAVSTKASTGGGTRVETNIGTINVQTQATDAKGMARDLPGALSQNSLVPAFQTGMN